MPAPHRHLAALTGGVEELPLARRGGHVADGAREAEDRPRVRPDDARAPVPPHEDVAARRAVYTSLPPSPPDDAPSDAASAEKTAQSSVLGGARWPHTPRLARRGARRLPPSPRPLPRGAADEGACAHSDGAELDPGGVGGRACAGGGGRRAQRCAGRRWRRARGGRAASPHGDAVGGLEAARREALARLVKARQPMPTEWTPRSTAMVSHVRCVPAARARRSAPSRPRGRPGASRDRARRLSGRGRSAARGARVVHAADGGGVESHLAARRPLHAAVRVVAAAAVHPVEGQPSAGRRGRRAGATSPSARAARPHERSPPPS